MARPHFWTDERENDLRVMVEAGMQPAAIVEAFAKECRRKLSEEGVRQRAWLIGVRFKSPSAFWTDERDTKLRELWAHEPRLRLAQIVAGLGGGISEPAVSARAAKLGLPSRYSSVTMRLAETEATKGKAALPVRRRASRAGEFQATSDPGRKLHAGVTTPRPRVVHAPTHTPCPFYLGHGERCGEIVDRREGALGIKPSPYCNAHKARVLPVSKGAIGTLATYAKGHKFA